MMLKYFLATGLVITLLRLWHVNNDAEIFPSHRSSNYVVKAVVIKFSSQLKEHTDS